jgi:hypothetical protein
MAKENLLYGLTTKVSSLSTNHQTEKYKNRPKLKTLAESLATLINRKILKLSLAYLPKMAFISLDQ